MIGVNLSRNEIAEAAALAIAADLLALAEESAGRPGGGD